MTELLQGREPPALERWRNDWLIDYHALEVEAEMRRPVVLEEGED